jgi:hypothetical protein
LLLLDQTQPTDRQTDQPPQGQEHTREVYINEQSVFLTKRMCGRQ